MQNLIPAHWTILLNSGAYPFLHLPLSTHLTAVCKPTQNCIKNARWENHLLCPMFVLVSDAADIVSCKSYPVTLKLSCAVAWYKPVFLSPFLKLFQFNCSLLIFLFVHYMFSLFLLTDSFFVFPRSALISLTDIVLEIYSLGNPLGNM